MKNRLREILRRNEVAFGITVTIGHPDIAEILGEVGFDFINFDTQHTPLSIETVQTMMQAMNNPKTTPIVRVQWNDFAMINRALDIGAHGIIIPYVNTREEALKAIQYASYPPRGIRSYGPRRAMLKDPEYMSTANEEILIMPQIETKKALNNIEEILSIDEIEAFFVGPYDLSMSLGVFAQWDHPIMEKALARIIEVAEDYGKKAGMLAPIEPIEKTIKRGFKLINIGGDVTYLRQAAEDSLQKAKSALSTLNP